MLLLLHHFFKKIVTQVRIHSPHLLELMMMKTTSRAVLALLLLFVVFTITTTPSANALKQFVVDTDGGTDGLCALATILQDPIAKDQLTLVTVSGNQWTSLHAAVENVRNFLHLAGKSNVLVAAGTTVSMGDISGSSSRFTGEASSSAANQENETFSHCEDGRHFPATPEAASAMGIAVSLYDVDGLYGYADDLEDSPAPHLDWPISPPAELAKSPFGIKFGATLPSTVALRNVIEEVSTGSGTVTYIALSGLTNLGLYLQSVNESAALLGSSSASKLILETSIHRIKLYVMGNGNSLGLDAVATGYIFGNYANNKTSADGIFTTIYAPPLLSRITFSFSSWSELSVLAASEYPSAPAVQFVIRSLSGRKKKFEAFDGGSDSSTAFFHDHAVDASFVVMAIIDSEVRSAVGGVAFLQGSAFLTRPTYSAITGEPSGEAHFPLLGKTDSAAIGNSAMTKNYTLAGNSVVRAAVLSIVGGTSGNTQKGPGAYIGEASNNLLDVFWRKWVAALKKQ